MAARTFDEIYRTLAPNYQAEQDLVRKQQAALQPEQDAAIAGLDTAKENAFGDIVNQANSRGMVYSGAPIHEENRYVGEYYLPKRAGVVSDFGKRRSALEAALLDTQSRQRQEATSIYNVELQDDREREAARRAASSAGGGGGLNLASLLGGGGAGAAAAVNPQDELLADIRYYITPDWQTRWLPNFTERTLIPKLRDAYKGQFSEEQIKQMVYNFRKQYEQQPNVGGLTGGLARR